MSFKLFKNQPQEKGNINPAVIILGFIIIGSIAYFGSFWYRVASENSKSQPEETETLPSTTQQNTRPEPAEVSDEVKSEVPNVELFVMSHCPYGTQMEKGMIPVIKTLGDNMDFELKFVDYAMHDKVELDEQLTQYCIQENNSDTLLSYLECFLEEGDSPGCVSEVGLNQETLDSCIQATDTEFAVTSSYEDKSTWVNGTFPPFNIHAEENEEYGVRGSPTLVVNGKITQPPSRDPNSLLSTVCGYFTEAPEECNTALNTQVPGPGFGYDSSGSANSASCN